MYSLLRSERKTEEQGEREALKYSKVQCNHNWKNKRVDESGTMKVIKIVHYESLNQISTNKMIVHQHVIAAHSTAWYPRQQLNVIMLTH